MDFESSGWKACEKRHPPGNLYRENNSRRMSDEMIFGLMVVGVILLFMGGGTMILLLDPTLNPYYDECNVVADNSAMSLYNCFNYVVDNPDMTGQEIITAYNECIKLELKQVVDKILNDCLAEFG